MKTFATLALGTCMTVAFAGAGFAQSSTTNMTAAEKATMTKCQAMSPSAMQSSTECSALMKKYPDAIPGTTGSGSGSMNGSSTTSPSTGGGGMTPSSPSR